MAGVNMLHMPYRGGHPRFTDLIAEQVQVTVLGFGGHRTRQTRKVAPLCVA